MEWLFSGGAHNNNETPDATVTIEKLCDRVRDASLLEDRRGAVQGLRGLSRDWQLQVGTKGMPVFVKVLREDRMDVEITKLTLETLNILCSNKKDDEQKLGSVLTEIFIKDSNNVSLLLDLLSEVDFYVRFNGITLLSTILANVGSALHEGVLTSPLGVSRLIDLLDDRREIIRNEGLLFLIQLTANNTDIQKIVAFENAFERLFTIICEEGSLDGGIIVQDCLQLMHNLLHNNTSNQSLFRETSCIKRVPKLFFITKSVPRKGSVEFSISDPAIEWTDQKIVNCTYLLDFVRTLVKGNNQNTTTNQNLLGQMDLVSTIFSLAMENVVPVSIRVKSLLTVGDLISFNEINRDRLAAYSVSSSMIVSSATAGIPNQRLPVEKPVESLLCLISTTLEKNDSNLRAAALHCFRCYIDDNIEAQTAFASALDPKANSQIGKKILEGLMDLGSAKKDPFITWYAATLFIHIIMNNSHAKDIVLRIEFQEHGEKILLLHKIGYLMLIAQQDQVDNRIFSGILALLAVWLFESTSSVKEFFVESSNMQFIIEQITVDSTGPIVQGLAAFLYGIVYQFNDGSEKAFTRESLHSLLTSRIGLDLFKSRVQRLKESKAYNHSETKISDDAEIIFDASFLDFLREHLDYITKAITAPKQTSAASKKEVQKVDLSIEIELKRKLEESSSALAARDAEISKLNEIIQNLTNEMEELKHQTTIPVVSGTVTQSDLEEKIKSLETDQEDLYLCLADQALEIKELKTRLKGYGESFDDDELQDEI